MNPAKEWVCDVCRVTAIQTGVRALELLPTPPHGWVVVDTTRILPSRAIGEGIHRQKIGETRDTTRRVYCPTCGA